MMETRMAETTETPALVEVTQADRDAARAIWDEGHERVRGEAMDASFYAREMHIEVMAEHLARHRLAAERTPSTVAPDAGLVEAVAAETDRCAKLASRFTPRGAPDIAHETARDIAIAIRAPVVGVPADELVSRIPFPSADGSRGIGGNEDAARALARQIKNYITTQNWREGRLIELCEAALTAPAQSANPRGLVWQPISQYPSDKHGRPLEAVTDDCFLLIFAPELLDEDFNPTGIGQAHYQDGGTCDEPIEPGAWVAPKWCNSHDEFHLRVVNPTHFAFVSPALTAPAPADAAEREVERLREAVRSHLTWLRRFVCDQDEVESTTPRKLARNAVEAADGLEAVLTSTREAIQ